MSTPTTALRHYEVMVILDPNLEERTIAPSLDAFLSVVKKDGGSVEKVDVWGRVTRTASAYDRGQPAFRGIFENNDPTKRLLVLINFNTDISQYWEFSANGFMPIDASNEAYKFGINYLIYALTH